MKNNIVVISRVDLGTEKRIRRYMKKSKIKFYAAAVRDLILKGLGNSK